MTEGLLTTTHGHWRRESHFSSGVWPFFSSTSLQGLLVPHSILQVEH